MSNHNIVSTQFFQSLTDAIEHAINGESVLVEASRSSREKGNVNFYGTDSFESTVHLAQWGWDEGLRQMKGILPDVKRRLDILTPKQDYSSDVIGDIVGGSVDVGKFLSGDPAHMNKYKPSFEHIISGDVLQRIYIEVAVSCFISPETIFYRGAVLCGMIEVLENLGFRIELITNDARASGGDAVVRQVVIKQFDEHTDIDKLTFSLANASYLRRLGFSLDELYPEVIIHQFGFKSSGGYGRPLNQPIYKDPEKDIYLPLPTSNMAIDEAVAWGVEVINERFRHRVEKEDNSHLDEDGPGMNTPKEEK
jgi:hypothetical protein